MSGRRRADGEAGREFGRGAADRAAERAVPILARAEAGSGIAGGAGGETGYEFGRNAADPAALRGGPILARTRAGTGIAGSRHGATGCLGAGVPESAGRRTGAWSRCGAGRLRRAGRREERDSVPTRVQMSVVGQRAKLRVRRV